MLAGALDVDGSTVRTSQGSFRGAAVVDATGWRAVLGSRLRPGMVRRERLNFGLETTVAYSGDGLHFWYDPRGLLAMGVTWAFPTGALARIGIGSYDGRTQLGPRLEHFLGQLGRQRNGLHGTYFPHALREPTVGDLFLVGDAAGQCLGLTGEGIRPALFFGTHLGHLLRQALDHSDHSVALSQARDAYRRLVAGYRPGYELLCLAQRALPRLPLRLVQAVMAAIEQPAVRRAVLARYIGSFPRGVPTVGHRYHPGIPADRRWEGRPRMSARDSATARPGVHAQPRLNAASESTATTIRDNRESA
ncbi:MAG: hypothetical protein HYU88_01130 [Chloroflexi bacterium]|nr:hypothetical protein [Chloroflexota bacterium]